MKIISINKNKYSILICIIFLAVSHLVVAQKKEKHLFILSGQSNMQLLRPQESFLPILRDKFGNRNVAVAKYALGTQPIRRWYKDWKSANGDVSDLQADLYDSLMVKVNEVIERRKIDPKKAASITFIWMQGERDAREGHGEVYEKSLLGLYHQLCKDLGRNDINFIIGRLSDFGIEKKAWSHWNMIREIQVKIAQSNPRFAWINTDDLNTGINRQNKDVKDDIHMSVKGYVIMGERFAKKAINLIENNKM